jgi:hypothetical protein
MVPRSKCGTALGGRRAGAAEPCQLPPRFGLRPLARDATVWRCRGAKSDWPPKQTRERRTRCASCDAQVSSLSCLPPISWPFRGVRSRARPASTPRAGHDRIDPCVVCCADFPIRFSFSALVGSQRRTYLRVQCPSVKHTHARSAVTVRPGPVKSKSVLVISRTVTALGSVDRSGPTGTTTHAGPWVAYACVPERASVVALPRLLSLSVSDHRPGKRESVQSSPVRRASPPPVGSA